MLSIFSSETMYLKSEKQGFKLLLADKRSSGGLAWRSRVGPGGARFSCIGLILSCSSAHPHTDHQEDGAGVHKGALPCPALPSAEGSLAYFLLEFPVL